MTGFSALQRAEIAEMLVGLPGVGKTTRFSALQRAEIAEIMPTVLVIDDDPASFSALQRAEIAEISGTR